MFIRLKLRVWQRIAQVRRKANWVRLIKVTRLLIRTAWSFDDFDDLPVKLGLVNGGNDSAELKAQVLVDLRRETF